MHDRELIFTRIKEGLKKNQTRPGEDFPISREGNGLLMKRKKAELVSALQREHLLNRFKEECELLSAKVYFCYTPSSALLVLGTIIHDSAITRVVRWEGELVSGLDIDGFLYSQGVIDIVPGDRLNKGASDFKIRFEETAKAELGITGADYAIADTGTIVFISDGGKERSTSILPPKHVVFLDSEHILPCMDDLILRLMSDFEKKGKFGACVTLVSGPSKTADIEMNLVHGVHGPGELHVILLSRS